MSLLFRKRLRFKYIFDMKKKKGGKALGRET